MRPRKIMAMLGSVALIGAAVAVAPVESRDLDMIIDDFSCGGLVSQVGTRWSGVSDQVMGGISQVVLTKCTAQDEPCLRLTGDVRIENNGGFIQAALDLTEDGRTFDASSYKGIRLVVQGNGEEYGLHLRTSDIMRPWQSYRAQFRAGSDWEVIELSFSDFVSHMIDVPLNTQKLRRLGLIAIGRQFHADLSVKRLEFYR